VIDNEGQILEKEADFRLVKEFLNGDESAFNKLVQKYQQKIYWHARKMTGNHLDADDIVQEVLLVMYNKLKNFKFESSVYTWIYRITTTRSINFLNKKKLKNIFSFSDEGKDEYKDNEDIVKTIENKEKLEKLDKVLMQLPKRQREVFIMRHFDELSYEEIAEITGKSVGGLKANYFYAFEKVNDLMKDSL